jgi:hypothetical protein
VRYKSAKRGFPVYQTASARLPPMSAMAPSVRPTPKPTEFLAAEAELGFCCGTAVGDLVRDVVLVLEGVREGKGGVGEAEGVMDGVGLGEPLPSGQRRPHWTQTSENGQTT